MFGRQIRPPALGASIGQLQRRPDRVSVAPRADKYGDVSERLHEKRRDRNEPSGVGE
jgi:hypothetical protein